MRRLFQANGLTVLYESAGPAGGPVRYLAYFAAKEPAGWADRLPATPGTAEAVLRAAL
jgi:hypothetical protein